MTAKGDRGDGGRGPARAPLRSGRAIKVFAHERVEAEEPGERRACKKEKSKVRGKSLMPRRLRGAARRPADVPRSMIDRYDWGPSDSQLVARHVRIITQHARVSPRLPFPFPISVKGGRYVREYADWVSRPLRRPSRSGAITRRIRKPCSDRGSRVHGIHYSDPKTNLGAVTRGGIYRSTRGRLLRPIH